MYCINCGKKNEDDAALCTWCMREVQKRTILPYRFRKLALIGLIVIALGFGGKTILDINRVGVLSVSPSRSNIAIANDQFTVARGNYWRQRFDVLKGWKNARILGKFTAAGTTSEGVEMFLVTQEAFEQFVSRQTHPTLYDSGRTTSGTINQLLDPGSYYLFVENPAGSSSDMAVTATVKLEYTVN